MSAPVLVPLIPLPMVLSFYVRVVLFWPTFPHSHAIALTSVDILSPELSCHAGLNC